MPTQSTQVLLTSALRFHTGLSTTMHRCRHDWLGAGRAFHLLAESLKQKDLVIRVYTALEVNRAYRILGRTMIYRERVFEEDHPPSFIFVVPSTGESVAYFLEQLTHYEETGQLQYLGLIPESME